MAPMSNKTKASIVVALLLNSDEKKTKRKRKWCKNWLLERNRYSNANLLHELSINEPRDFQKFLRMDETTFQSLLEMIRPKITKQDTNMRPSVTAEERLIVTLR